MPGIRGSGWYCGANIAATVSGFRTAPRSPSPPARRAAVYRAMSRRVETAPPAAAVICSS